MMMDVVGGVELVGGWVGAVCGWMGEWVGAVGGWVGCWVPPPPPTTHEQRGDVSPMQGWGVFSRPRSTQKAVVKMATDGGCGVGGWMGVVGGLRGWVAG